MRISAMDDRTRSHYRQILSQRNSRGPQWATEKNGVVVQPRIDHHADDARERQDFRWCHGGQA